MTYGVQLFDANSNELTERFIPASVAAFTNSPASGTRASPIIERETPVVEPQRFSSPLDLDLSGTTTTVTGNKTVTWSKASTDQLTTTLYK